MFLYFRETSGDFLAIMPRVPAGSVGFWSRLDLREFLPSKEQVVAARRAKKQIFIAGETVAGNLPENWQHAATVGIDAILTDYPLEMRTAFRRK